MTAYRLTILLLSAAALAAVPHAARAQAQELAPELVSDPSHTAAIVSKMGEIMKSVGNQIEAVQVGFDAISGLYSEVNNAISAYEDIVYIYTVAENLTQEYKDYIEELRSLQSAGALSYTDFYNEVARLQGIISRTGGAISMAASSLERGLREGERLTTLRFAAEIASDTYDSFMRYRRKTEDSAADVEAEQDKQDAIDGILGKEDDGTSSSSASSSAPEISESSAEAAVKESRSIVTALTTPVYNLIWAILGVTGLGMLGFNTWKYFRSETMFGPEDAFVRIAVGLVLAALVMSLLQGIFT